jgi:hypothetical protein
MKNTVRLSHDQIAKACREYVAKHGYELKSQGKINFHHSDSDGPYPSSNYINFVIDVETKPIS